MKKFSSKKWNKVPGASLTFQAYFNSVLIIFQKIRLIGEGNYFESLPISNEKGIKDALITTKKPLTKLELNTVAASKVNVGKNRFYMAYRSDFLIKRNDENMILNYAMEFPYMDNIQTYNEEFNPFFKKEILSKNIFNYNLTVKVPKSQIEEDMLTQNYLFIYRLSSNFLQRNSFVKINIKNVKKDANFEEGLSSNFVHLPFYSEVKNIFGMTFVKLKKGEYKISADFKYFLQKFNLEKVNRDSENEKFDLYNSEVKNMKMFKEKVKKEFKGEDKVKNKDVKKPGRFYYGKRGKTNTNLNMNKNRNRKNVNDTFVNDNSNNNKSFIRIESKKNNKRIKQLRENEIRKNKVNQTNNNNNKVNQTNLNTKNVTNLNTKNLNVKFVNKNNTKFQNKTTNKTKNTNLNNSSKSNFKQKVQIVSDLNTNKTIKNPENIITLNNKLLEEDKTQNENNKSFDENILEEINFIEKKSFSFTNKNKIKNFSSPIKNLTEILLNKKRQENIFDIFDSSSNSNSKKNLSKRTENSLQKKKNELKTYDFMPKNDEKSTKNIMKNLKEVLKKAKLEENKTEEKLENFEMNVIRLPLATKIFHKIFKSNLYFQGNTEYNEIPSIQTSLRIKKAKNVLIYINIIMTLDYIADFEFKLHINGKDECLSSISSKSKHIINENSINIQHFPPGDYQFEILYNTNKQGTVNLGMNEWDVIAITIVAFDV